MKLLAFAQADLYVSPLQRGGAIGMPARNRRRKARSTLDD